LTGAVVEVPGTAALVAGSTSDMNYYAASVTGCNAFVVAESENFRGLRWKHRPIGGVAVASGATILL